MIGHFRRYATSAVTSAMYGTRIPRSSSPNYVDLDKVSHTIAYMYNPSEHPPVDLIPILKYVPERFARWKTQCRDVRIFERKVQDTLLQPVKDRLARDDGNGCYMETVFSRAEEWKLDPELIR
jgi:hypothetical protein